MASQDMATTGAAKPPAGEEFASLSRLRKQFEDYRTSKAGEVEEQREARLYYHGSQWTAKQLAELKKRGQPPITTPKFARKINGFVGLVERLRQDPKAYPRTGKEEQGAELSTSALRYALDQQQWDAKSPIVSQHGAVDAIGGIELGLEEGDQGTPGDYDVSIDYVEPDTFFYDPRSFRHDFSDARFKGISKWLDLDDAIENWPDMADALREIGENSGSEFSLDSDRESKWVNTSAKQLLVVEHWYRRGSKWLWCFYVGPLKLDEGRSYLQDEKGRDICRFIMWRAFIDQDGDSYSFHRPMKPLVDEINQRRSKALHLLAMRRVRLQKGAVQDIEVLRREAIRPDGVIEYNPGFELDFEDAKTLADMQAQLEMLKHAEQELENFGPNPALVGQGVEAKSGKAIQLLQQAGIAELGPYIISYRQWKIRVYRAVWNAIRRHWVAERWIRVTDEDGNEQSLPVNTQTDPETGAQAIDPQTGQPMIFNKIGALDVDIIIDEGPDSITMMADALETLQAAMASGTQIPAVVMIELLPIPASLKRKLLGMIQESQQPSEGQQAAEQIQIQQGQAKVEETRANAMLKMAQAGAAQQPQAIEQPAPMDGAADFAAAEERHASTVLKLAQARKTETETDLMPLQFAHQRERDAAMASRAAEPRRATNEAAR